MYNWQARVLHSYTNHWDVLKKLSTVHQGILGRQALGRCLTSYLYSIQEINNENSWDLSGVKMGISLWPKRAPDGWARCAAYGVQPTAWTAAKAGGLDAGQRDWTHVAMAGTVLCHTAVTQAAAKARR